MKKIFIGIPSYNNNMLVSMCGLLGDIRSKSKYKRLVDIRYKVGMPIHKARNFLVEEFLADEEFGYMLMIDSDNPISVEGFDKLVEDVVGGKDIVCGVITSRKKTGLGEYCIAIVDEKVDQFGIKRPYEWYKLPIGERLVEVDNCGTGCVMYSRRVIQDAFDKYLTIYEFQTDRYILNDSIVDGKVVETNAVPLIELYDTMFYPIKSEDGISIMPIDVSNIPKNKYVCQPFGEDLFAHSRMKSLGYKIRCDTTVIGKHIISWNEYTTITHDMYEGLVLSIVIPVYNNHKFIRQIVKNISDVVKVKHEIIIVDDGSNKNSEIHDILEHIFEQENVELISFVKNEGTNHARMAGINEAKGKFVLVINDDVLLEDGLVEKMIDSIDDNNVISCPVSTTGNKPFEGDEFIKQNNICGWCWMTNRDYFVENIGEIPDNLKLWFGDDRIFHSVVEDLKKNVIIVRGKLCHHFESQTIGKQIKGEIKKIIDKDRDNWINICLLNGWTDYRFNIIKGVLQDNK